jgi:hypothetical protein
VIGKIAKGGRSAMGAGLYIVYGRKGEHIEGEAPRGQYLDSSFPLGSEPEAIFQTMEDHAHAMRPGLGVILKHVSLSAAPGEHLSEEQWRAVAGRWRDLMGYEGCDYYLVRHSDTAKDHVHMIVSRVRIDGSVVSDSNERIRQSRVTAILEREFGLVDTHNIEHLRAHPEKVLSVLDRRGITFTESNLRYRLAPAFSDAELDAVTKKLLASCAALGIHEGQQRYALKDTVRLYDHLGKQYDRLLDARWSPCIEVPQKIDVTDRKSGKTITLDKEQRDAVAFLFAEGGSARFVEGFAGTGKTTLLQGAYKIAQEHGYKMLGGALAGVAAEGLEIESGVKSNTLASTLLAIERGKLRLDANTIFVVDETNMSDARSIDLLAAYCADAGAKIWYVGDREQLAAVEHPGALDMGIDHAGGAYTLETVRRQKNAADRQASVDFGRGESRKAVDHYIENSLSWHRTQREAKAALVSNYLRDRAEVGCEQVYALAYQRAEVTDLNARIRAELKERGELKDERVYHASQDEAGTVAIPLATGDRIVCTKNHKPLDVKNGKFGTVVALRGDAVRVQFDDGKTRDIKPSDYGFFAHGYASTIHKSEGGTRVRVHGLADSLMDSRLTNITCTRHKDRVILYGSIGEFGTKEKMAESLSRRNTRTDDDLRILKAFRLDPAINAQQEQDYAAQREELRRAGRELAARTAALTQSRAQEEFWRLESEVTRRGADVVRMLPCGDLEITGPGHLPRAVYGLSGRGDAEELDREMRGIRHSDPGGGEARQMSFQEIQRAMRDDIMRRGVSAPTADLARRAAIEPDTLVLSPTHTASGGYHLVARAKATGTEYLLRDARGERFRFASAAEALEARNALREQAAAKLGKRSEGPDKHVPDIRDADTHHMTGEIAAEAKRAGVELRGPDGEHREPERPAPSDRALDLTDLAGRYPYTLRALRGERGGYNLALVDSSSAVEPEMLTDATGRALSYESADAAEADVGRLIEHVNAREREHAHDHCGRSR